MKEEYEIRRNAGIDVKYISEENNYFSLDIKGGVYGVNGGSQLDHYEYIYIINILLRLPIYKKIYKYKRALKFIDYIIQKKKY